MVPSWGWQSMFYIGAIPAIIALVLRFVLPESPRWLASRGRMDEAEKALKQIEVGVEKAYGKPLPPPVPQPTAPVQLPSWSDVFGGVYLRRTLMIWALWFCAYFIGYGLSTWLADHVPPAHEHAADDGAELCADRPMHQLHRLAHLCAGDRPYRPPQLGHARLRRRRGGLHHHVADRNADARTRADPRRGHGNVRLHQFACALRPIRRSSIPRAVRALAVSAATAWLRLASAIAPICVGYLIQNKYGIPSVWLMFAIVAAIGILITALFAIETKERVLEEISK